MVAKAFSFCLAQLALSATIIMFQKHGFVNPDEGWVGTFHSKIFEDAPVIPMLQRSVFIHSQRQDVSTSEISSHAMTPQISQGPLCAFEFLTATIPMMVWHIMGNDLTKRILYIRMFVYCIYVSFPRSVMNKVRIPKSREQHVDALPLFQQFAVHNQTLLHSVR